MAQEKNKYNTPKYRMIVRLTNKDITCQVCQRILIIDFSIYFSIDFVCAQKLQICKHKFLRLLSRGLREIMSFVQLMLMSYLNME